MTGATNDNSRKVRNLDLPSAVKIISLLVFVTVITSSSDASPVHVVLQDDNTVS